MRTAQKRTWRRLLGLSSGTEIVEEYRSWEVREWRVPAVRGLPGNRALGGLPEVIRNF